MAWGRILDPPLELANLASCPEQVVPLLVEKLSSSNSTIRLVAVRGLSDFGMGAKPAVPALRAALDDHEVMIRNIAEDCLSRLVPEMRRNTNRN